MADQYHLKTGESGEQQLDNLDRFFGESSREFLMRIGVEKGMRILDVGCGVGNGLNVLNLVWGLIVAKFHMLFMCFRDGW